jgi:hypothetical protein
VPSAKKPKKPKKADDEQSGPNEFLRRCIPAAYEAVADPLEDDELVELDWFAPAHTGAVQAELSKNGKKNTTPPVKGIPAPASQVLPTRRWHSFSATKMTLDAELEDIGEVRLSDGRFSFPFNAQVIQCFSPLDMFLTFQIIGRSRRKLSAPGCAASKHIYLIILCVF